MLCHLRHHNEGGAALTESVDTWHDVFQPVVGAGCAFNIEASGDAAMAALLECPVAARGELGTLDAAAYLLNHDDAFALLETSLFVHA